MSYGSYVSQDSEEASHTAPSLQLSVFTATSIQITMIATASHAPNAVLLMTEDYNT